jgi:hypothetical protein
MPSSSCKVFDAMEAGDWNQVDEILATTSLIGEELELKHGVLSYTCSNLN